MTPPSVGSPDADERVWRFDAIGTVWEVVTAAPLSAAERGDVRVTIDAFDREWSRFRPDSIVTALQTRGGSEPLPADGAPMLDMLAEVSDATGGRVDPLIGGTLAHRGYDAAYSFVDRGAVARTEPWRDVLHWDAGRLTLDGPALIDVGALGKGRLVDLVAAALPGPVVVDAGGDMRIRGRRERVALEHPYDATRAIGVVEVEDAAICASATNRRTWGDGLHHVLDARTGEPVRRIAATWAIADTTMRADAAATALFFDGGAELAARWGVEWVRMTTDGRVEWSPRSTVEVFA